jgi:spermidine synthase
VTDQQRQLVTLAGECFQEGDHVGNHDVGPVAPARGRVEAGRFAVPARVRRDDAVAVTPPTHRIRPAQSRVGETVQQHQGRAIRTSELVNTELVQTEGASHWDAWVSHGQKYRRVPPRLADVEADQDGRIALVPDEDGRGGVTVMMDGSPQSHVDLADPGNLGFEYIAHFAAVIDTLPAGPLAITHIGGAGLTLARYVNAERPGSPQIVLEPNAELTELVRRELPLPRQHRIRVRPVDGLNGISQLAEASADVVVLDAYANGRVPSELSTVEFLTDVCRVLRPSGTFLLNIADEPNKAYLRHVYAGLVTVFGQVAMIGTHEVLKGKRFGNTVAVASRNPLDLPVLRRQVAKSPFPTGLRDEAQLNRQFAGSVAFTTEDSAQSPPPPPVKGWRVR